MSDFEISLVIALSVVVASWLFGVFFGAVMALRITTNVLEEKLAEMRARRGAKP